MMRLTFLAPILLAGCMGGVTNVVLPPEGLPPPESDGPFVPPVPPGDPFLAYGSFQLRLNDERSANGVRLVEENAVLNSVATAHARDLVTYNYLSHIGRDGSTPTDRAEAGGYDATYMGEVLARGPYTEETVLDGWMSSPGHRAVITAPQAEDFGLGRVDSTWVLMLGAEAQ